jgi:hypothetical protein
MTKHNPQKVAAKLQKVVDAWTTLRPTKSFAGMTLEQFQTQIQPSLAVRAQLTTLKGQTVDSRNQRVQSDSASVALAQLVVNAVRGDVTEGENGSLYAAMGYIPKNERRSGLTRKGAATAPVPAAVPTAAVVTPTVK